jgi:hypothetical protein
MDEAGQALETEELFRVSLYSCSDASYLGGEGGYLCKTTLCRSRHGAADHGN